MKEKLIKRLYEFYSCTDEDLNNGLWENLNDIINNKGKKGAEELLDWCVCEYDNIRERYMELKKIDETEMEKILDENFGNYDFIYNDDIDLYNFAKEVDEIWDLSNFYLDYCNGDIDENKMLYYLGVI